MLEKTIIYYYDVIYRYLFYLGIKIIKGGNFMEENNDKVYTRYHLILELSSWAIMLVAYGIAIYGINTLPDTIATHFDAHGIPDGYGSPGTLLILPIIMTLVLGLLSLIAHTVPSDALNLPFKVNENRRVEVDRLCVGVVFVFNLLASIFTVIMTYLAYKQAGKAGLAAVIAYLACMAIVITTGIIKAKNINDRE